jgi:hypothetical protein
LQRISGAAAGGAGRLRLAPRTASSFPFRLGVSLFVLVADLVCSSLQEELGDVSFFVGFLVNTASLFKVEQLLI